jgi:hypothetical protein
MTDGSGGQPATKISRPHRARRRRWRSRNAVVVGRRSFVAWYQRLGSGVALLVMVVLIGALIATVIAILVGLALLFLGNAIG